MAMSRSDMGMMAILGLAALGFFIFSARKNEREAKKAKDAKENIAIDASLSDLSKDDPTKTSPTPVVETTPTETKVQNGAGSEKIQDAGSNVENGDGSEAKDQLPIPGSFPGEFTTAGVEPINVNEDEVKALIARYERCPVGVILVGHTDGVGSEKRNGYISMERAKAVMALLIKSGMAADTIRVEGVGAKTPTAPNNSTKGRYFNRRVEISCAVE